MLACDLRHALHSFRTATQPPWVLSPCFGTKPAFLGYGPINGQMCLMVGGDVVQAVM